MYKPNYQLYTKFVFRPGKGKPGFMYENLMENYNFRRVCPLLNIILKNSLLWHCIPALSSQHEEYHYC